MASGQGLLAPAPASAIAQYQGEIYPLRGLSEQCKPAQATEGDLQPVGRRVPDVVPAGGILPLGPVPAHQE